MDRSLVIELLARKMAGEATPEELLVLEELIASFPDAVYYEELLNELWRQSPVHAMGKAETDRLLTQHLHRYHKDFEDNVATEAEETASPLKNSMLLAALTVVLLIAVLLFLDKSATDRYTTEIVAGKGIRKKLKLPDGTLVWLNAESSLRYHSDFNKQKTRKVYLRGEAFFDVVHLASRPFIVRTDKISVKVLGTAFNIQAYPREQKSEATLLRGSIELSVNDRSGQKVILSPSEKFAFMADKRGAQRRKTLPHKDIRLMVDHVSKVKIGQQEYIEETSWKDNQLVFKNESLDQLKPKFERWFNVKIHLESSASKSYRFTGVFTKENLNEALTAMQLVKPFTFKLSANEVTIY